MGAASGRFVWFELMTTDVEGAKRFYGDVIGWKVTPWSGGKDYELWVAGKEEVGGVMALKPEARKAGSPPHWLGYVATDDVDATAQKAQKLGGRVLVPAMDVANSVRIAVLADPQGAAFGVVGMRGGETRPDMRALGHAGWAELNTTDWKAGWSFYSQLLGWRKVSSMDMGPEFGEYFMFGLEPEAMLGGMSDAAKMMKAPAHWLHYLNVKSVDETVKRIPEKGGKVLNGPMDVPGGSRIAQCMDPQGAMFAILSSPS